MLALLALYDSLLFTIENFVHKVVGRWNIMFDSIKKKISKLVYIHLDLYVCLFSIKIFESFKEIRIEIGFSTIM